LYAYHVLPPVPESYASDRYCIPPTYYVFPSPCPYVSPGTLYDYPSLQAGNVAYTARSAPAAGAAAARPAGSQTGDAVRPAELPPANP
jgi:hypothetical protein